ncbi:Zinc finger SWIM domain-containing protein 7 [Trametes pubescens]|uniref:Zinc finger SWIM domain-containing protein 7 n=1 Tax=Trametes pubescens TaxID=154538 RepID=A0A1M2VH76_TRAPU|nr:Zinc finger SWIM domain-containing protein 7 [Trametes pubescens]
MSNSKDSNSGIAALLEEVIQRMTAETLDDSLEKLRFFFPETLLLGALDLIDRDSVIVYNTPWGRPQYEVLGSTATYAVFPGLPSGGGHTLAYCTCPAYAYSVLLSETQLMVRTALMVYGGN